MDLRKLISRCKECNGITFMAVYDTTEEIVDAAPSVIKLQKEGREVEVIIHKSGDKMPEWCVCENDRLPT